MSRSTRENYQINRNVFQNFLGKYFFCVNAWCQSDRILFTFQRYYVAIVDDELQNEMIVQHNTQREFMMFNAIKRYITILSNFGAKLERLVYSWEKCVHLHYAM